MLHDVLNNETNITTSEQNIYLDLQQSSSALYVVLGLLQEDRSLCITNDGLKTDFNKTYIF